VLELIAWSSAGETYYSSSYLIKLLRGSFLLKLSSEATFMSYLLELPEEAACWVYCTCWVICWSKLLELLELSLSYLVRVT